MSDLKPNAQRLRSLLRHFDRSPFRDALAQLLEAAPDAASLEDFAKRHPDRWTTAVKVMGGLAGYVDKTAIDIELTRIEDLSDAQLEERIRLQFARLREAGVDLTAPALPPAETEPTEAD